MMPSVEDHPSNCLKNSLRRGKSRSRKPSRRYCSDCFRVAGAVVDREAGRVSLGLCRCFEDSGNKIW